MRTYLVIIDDTSEAEVALRFAARRAVKTGGGVRILALIPPGEFVAWGGVQETMESEALEHAEAVIARALDMLGDEGDIVPQIEVRRGEAIAMIRETLDQHSDIAALVLGAASVGAPGPLVAHFAGASSGSLPCPIMIVPGSLSRDALDRLS